MIPKVASGSRTRSCVKKNNDRTHVADACAGARSSAQKGNHRRRADRRAHRRGRAEPRAQCLREGNAGGGARDGAGVGRAARERRGRSARRHPARHQGSVLHQGCAHHRGLAHPRRIHADLRVDRHGEPVARRRRDARQAQQRRVCDGLVERDLVLRPGGQPVAAQGLECRRGNGRADRGRASGAGRLVGRLGRGGCGAALFRRDRDRYRRLDPPAGGVHRHGRAEADLRALLALGDRGVCVFARSGGADRPHGARHRAADALDGGARSEGHDLASTCRCRTTRPRSAGP